ncbi:uncharacterized protein [Anabrus simplex]|uniref:uncharacterized protein n=1 Tax=Anabrus simplex TaxID=316456 RepID=UPI0035A2E188
MKVVGLVTMSFLVCASVAAHNKTMDLSSYIADLWKPRRNGLMGGFINPFAPKLDLRTLIELIRGQMTKPFPQLGLPALDPLQLDIISFDVDHEIGRFQGYLANVTALHLSQFEVERLVLNLTDFKAEFSISFSRIPLSAAYELQGSLAKIVPTWGIGNMQLEVHNLEVFGSLQVGIDRELLYIQSFDMDFSLRQITGDIRGLFGGGELGDVLSEVALEMAPMLVDMVRPQFSPWLSKQFLEESNKRLTDLAIKKTDVVEWLRQIVTEKILSFTRRTRRDPSQSCTIKNSLFTATYC